MVISGFFLEFVTFLIPIGLLICLQYNQTFSVRGFILETMQSVYHTNT